jgi:glycosidase
MRFKNLAKLALSVASLCLVAGYVQITASLATFTTPSYDLITHVPTASLPTNAEVKIYSSANPSQVIATSRLEALDNYGWWAVTRVPEGTDSICVSATGLQVSQSCLNPSSTKTIWLDAQGVPSLSRVEAAKNIKVHLSTSVKTGRFAVLNVNGVNQSAAFVRVGTDFVATFNVPKETRSYTIKTQSTIAKKLVDDIAPLSADAASNSEIYLTNGVSFIYKSIAEQTNTVYIHYNRPDGIYKSWGLHTWLDGNNGGALVSTTWAKPKLPFSSKADSWGVLWKIPLASFSLKLPYIIHKADLKDVPMNQYLDLDKYGYEIWIESGKTDVDGNYLVANPQLASASSESEQLSQIDAQALATSSARSSFANDSIYFVMPDRYKDGNSANNYGGINSTNRSTTGYDPYSDAYSHGGDLAGLSDGCNRSDGTGDGVPRIKRLGFSAIWITPPFKQNFVQGGSAAYHGYWINDFTTIDPHWGTNAEFKSFVDCAHRLGIKVILDIVVNHTGDIIYYTDNAYWFHNQPNSTGYIPPSAANLKSPSWLNSLSNYHLQGNIQDWSNKLQYQNGDFYGLDDIKTENLTVINGFADVYSNWINDFGVDGFRVDTAKHVDDQFFLKWLPKVINQTSVSMNQRNQKVFAFGEYFDSSSSNLSNYMRNYGLSSVLDFAFQEKAKNFASGGGANNLSDLFSNDNSFIAKDKSPYDLVTFLSNHDIGRLSFLLNQTGTTRSQSVLLAHDLMFLTRGIPTVYYGDEVGMIGNGGDKAARQDMFPTQVSQWRSEDRVFGSSIGTGSSLSISTPLTSRITLLNQLRKDNPALASGSQTLRVADTNALVVSRFDKNSRTEYLVGFNSGNSSKSVKVTSSTPLTSWQSLLGSGSVTSNASGEVSITIPARSTVIFKALNPLPIANDPVSVGLKINTAPGSTSIGLASLVPGSDLGTVTFVAKIGSGSWQTLGSDDSRDYGMTWDYKTLLGETIPIGTQVKLAAIYKSTSGLVSVSSLKTITIND